MPNILRQREIIDRRALAAELEETLAEATASSLDRRALLPALKAALARGRDEIRRRFEADGTAVRTVSASSASSSISSSACSTTSSPTRVYPLANPTAGEQLALVAVGGYGRGELAPFSDIDLLFLLPYKQTPHTEQVVEYLLYTLWDLGLKVGQATRSVDECLRYAKADLTIRTGAARGALRLGRAGAVRRAEDAASKPRSCKGTRGRSSSRRSSPSATQRHRALGDSAATRSSPTSRKARAGCAICTRCSGSPNTSTASTTSPSWSSAACCRPRKRSASPRAQNFLWTVRCHLHFLTGRAEERLTFDLQSEIGAAWATPTTPARAASSAS